MALIFSASDTGTGTVGEEFVGGLDPAVHIAEELDVAPEAPAASWHDRLVHLCTAFKKLGADFTEHSDVADELNRIFEEKTNSHRVLMREFERNSAQEGLAFDPPVLKFPLDVVKANHETVDQVDAARQQVDNNGDNTLSMVLIETNDEPKTAVLVVVLEGRLANLLKIGQDTQNVDIPSDDGEGPHQASVFKVTIDVLPMTEEGDGIVYSATVMVDVNLTRSMLLAEFCEAQNWPGSVTREHFLQYPVLDENTLEQMVYSGRVRNKTYQAVQRIQETESVYGQCRYGPPPCTQYGRGHVASGGESSSSPTGYV